MAHELSQQMGDFEDFINSQIEDEDYEATLLFVDGKPVVRIEVFNTDQKSQKPIDLSYPINQSSDLLS